MAASNIRVDYDQLKAVASHFGGLAQDSRQMMQALQRQIEILQAGDWVGPGATAFYQEMNGQVMPSLRRLAASFDQAQRTTNEISHIVTQAEEDAARALRGSGDRGRPAPLDSAGAFTADEAVSGANTLVDAANAIGGSSLAAAAATGILAGLKSGHAPDAVVGAVTQALEVESVERMLAGFDSRMRDLVKQSPTLRSEILKMERDGYTILTVPFDEGSSTNAAQLTIHIAASGAATSQVRSLAHEAGHATGGRPSRIAITGTMTRDEYLRLSVDNELLSEGEAAFNNARVRAELVASDGPDIDISGSQTIAYQTAYNDYTTGAATRQQAVERMAALYVNERAGAPPYKPYVDYYRDSFRQYWDTYIAPTRGIP